MKKVILGIILVVLLAGCENPNQDVPDVPVQNISINIADILFVGQQTYINIEFSPSNTTERNLIYSSSDENILTISSSGTITPLNKGTATISVVQQNGVEVNKSVSVYQIVTKPTIINETEEWGPYEKISGNGWNSGSTEIGINTGIEITIKPNTLVENARIIIAGKLFTENCEKENTIFSQVRISGNGELNLEDITIDRLYIDSLRNGNFTNCDFVKPPNSYDYAINGWFTSSRLIFINNIFNGNCDFSVFSFSGAYIFEYNQFVSTIRFPSSSSLMNYITLNYNIIDMQYFSFSGNATPNIDLSNNYWGTTDTQLIDNFIIDRNDSLSINYYVNYLPILTEKPEFSKYSVSFVTNGGSAVQSITNISEGEKINKPNDPTKQNFIFAGWFINENFETEWDFQNDTVEDNLTLYAKWRNPLYQYEVIIDNYYKVGSYLAVYWTNPVDENFSHVRIIPAGFEWVENMGGEAAAALDKEPDITYYVMQDNTNTEYLIVKCISKDGTVSEGITVYFD